MIPRMMEQNLARWYGGTHRKPLILRGARQVGKSTLVRQFAQNHNLDLIEINLERHRSLDRLFSKLDTVSALHEFSGIAGKNFGPESLLFLDEIQATPNALQLLRYLYEDHPNLPVIAAGSLLEFALSKASFSMPVGRVEYLYLSPLTFKEFLQSDQYLYEQLESITATSSVSASVHEKLLAKQREYLFVGGMPEAVEEYNNTGSLQNASSVHRSIVETYEYDFSKYTQHKDLALMQHVYWQCSRAVGQKVKYSRFSKDHQGREIKNALLLLQKAQIITKVFNSKCNGLPLHAELDELAYKLLHLDVGLMVNMTGLDWLSIKNFTSRELINEGVLAEQFIGQHLPAFVSGVQKPRPVYWLRESRSSNAEVDYVISQGDWIIPIEVKAGKSGTLKSLHQFNHEKKPNLSVRFDLNPPSLQHIEHAIRIHTGTVNVSYPLLSLPLYAIEELPKIVDQIRTQ